MNKVLCSTGAVLGRPNGRDIKLLNKCVELLECDGYEFLMYDTWYEKRDELCDFMSAFSVPVPVFHVDKTVGDLISRHEAGDTERALELFEMNCSLAKAFKSEKLVLHLWSGLDSDKNISHNIESYKYLRNISDDYGLALTVENVVCNNDDPMSHWITLVKAYPDIQFTFDTKMAAFHDQIDLLYKEDNRYIFANIKHMHINDYLGGYKDWENLNTLHIGNGNINFDKLFGFLNQMHYKGDFTVEATSFDQSGAIDFEALNRSFRKIRSHIV